MVNSIPYLSSPANGSPSGVTLGANTVRSLYLGVDKGAQDPPVSQHRLAKWWPDSVETKRHAHPICVASHRFKNCGHDCLCPRDFHGAITVHGELRHVKVSSGTPSITVSCANRGPPRVR
jgi:hypothetical protein